MANQKKITEYEDFVEKVLKEDLKKVLEQRDQAFENIAEYSQLKQTIELLQKTPSEDGLRTQVDLGANFYIQAHVSDTHYIYVNVGLGFYVQFTLPEAIKFIEKKIKTLNEDVKLSTEKSAKIKGSIKFVLEALRELYKLDLENKTKT